jgi:23S rRNA (uracil1939-C5)-methyltransferase
MPTVEISDLTLGPWGVGRIDGKAIMVPHSAPGDLLEVAIESERSAYAIGRLESVIRAGRERRVPPCPFLPRCGGCDWQQLEYTAQVAAKARLVAAEFARVLGVELPADGLVEPAPEEFGYRARVRFKVGAGGQVGFHEAASNRIVAVDRCLVAAPPIIVPLRFASALGRRCRELEAVAGEGYQVIVAHCESRPAPAEIERARRALDEEPSVRGLVVRSGDAREIFGDPTVALELEEGLTLEVDADHFSQVNRAQNRKLAAATMAAAAIAPGDEVLDLYCGAGNFSLPAARRGARVTGVDAQEIAIVAARRNAARLGLSDNAQFVAMKAGALARFMARARYRPGLVMLDPPRTGAADLIGLLSALRPRRVLYIACDVATLLRDLKALIRAGFRLGRVRGFDFFPNTHHVEVLAEMLLT